MNKQSYVCGNCGVFREIKDGMVEKCPNCGDDEFEMRWEDAEEYKEG
jgi:predicted  nucleic acid-binding Zn-ribbon protein